MDIPGNLVRKIADGNCVVFVGSGLSMGAGLPDWKGLLRQMMDWAEEHGMEISDREELESYIDEGDLLMVAQEMRERLGEESYCQFMVEVFCDPDLKPTDAHKQIPRIDFAAALTSNYDELLELAYEETQGELPHVFTYSNPADLATALSEENFYIFKVHGTIRDIETIVLERDDYRQLMYNNPACQKYLSALFLTKTVFFLGFSLTDRDLMSLLDELRTTFAGQTRPHYSLMNVRPIRRKRFERDYSVRVIPYDNHSEVPVFLSELAERLKQPEREEPGKVVVTAALERPSEIPELPSYFLERPEYFGDIKRSVLAGVGRIAAITGKPVGLHGMGGIGKSMLAAAVARDEDVQKAFPDGIVWLPVGQEPNIIACQRQAAIALGDNPPPFADQWEGTAYLKQLLKSKASLLVLDDVWQSEHAAAFNVMGKQCQMLLTTRIASIVRAMDADEHSLEVLSDDQAMELLAMTSEIPRDELPDVATEVAKECGNLPLALVAIGSMVRDKPDQWDAALNSLKEADLEKFKLDFPNCPHPNMMSSIQISVDALRLDVRERYMDFAVFLEDTPIPEAVLETFWKPKSIDKDKYDMQDVVDELLDRSMLRTDERGWLSPHDFQFDYVRKRAGDLPALHNRLVDAYAEQCKGGWHTGPNDGYFYQYLPYHLKEAGRGEELRELLLNFNWLQAKLEGTNPNALIDDYDRMSADSLSPKSGTEDLRLVRGAIQLSAHVLAQDLTQLAGQLLGRMLEIKSSGIQAMLKQAAQYKASPCLLPITSCLTPPGGPLFRTLLGHTDTVNSVSVTPGGHFAVSASNDNTLRVWDLETGKEMRTLKGHTDKVRSVCVTPDGRFVISASEDCTLKVWDIKTAREIRTFRGHTNGVRSVSVTPDGRLAVSASHDNTLRVWDLETGKEMRTLRGHTRYVKSVSVTPDSRFAVSASDDKTLKVWNIKSGLQVRTLYGHNHYIDSVSITPDGRFAVSASDDGTLKVWDIESGREIRTFEGHVLPVKSVSITPDGRFAVSASDDGTLKVWDIEVGREMRTLRGHTDKVRSVCVTPDGRFAVSASSDRTLKVWNLKSKPESHILQAHAFPVKSVSITPDGRFAVSASEDGVLKAWDIEVGREIRTLKGRTTHVYDKWVYLTPDGRFAITASSDNTIKISDVKGREKTQILKGGSSYAWWVSVTPDSRFAISSSDDDNNDLRMWAIESGEEIRRLKGHTDRINCVSVTLDGRFAISGSDDRTLRVWDLETGKTIASFSCDLPFGTCAVAPDGKTIVAGGETGQVHFLRLEGL